MLKAKQKLLIWPEVRTRGETVVQDYGVETYLLYSMLNILGCNVNFNDFFSKIYVNNRFLINYLFNFY